MTARFHLMESIEFAKGVLAVRVVELHEGAPDGLIGLPLCVTEKSDRYTVEFRMVGGFFVETEPCNTLSESAARRSAFLFEEHDSKYLADSGECARLFAPELSRVESPDIRHYVVYSEHFVVHVLAAEAPKIAKVSCGA